jgi:itaconyl-CoA hydratase
VTIKSEPQGYRAVGENRYRENVGFGFDDFVIGQVIEHRPGRTVTEMDNVLFSALSGNTAPIHTDYAFSAKSEWGQPLVCSLATLTIVGGMTVRSTSGLTVGNLGWTDIRLEHPVFIGDTLYAESEILGKRLSRSRPHNGIVTCRTNGYNQDGARVVSYERTFLVPADPEEIRARANY